LTPPETGAIFLVEFSNQQGTTTMTNATPTMLFTLAASLSKSQQQYRSNIRNGWFVMTSPEIKKEISNRLDRDDFFGVAVLTELLSEMVDEGTVATLRPGE
jgi:hypothetical protein